MQSVSPLYNPYADERWSNIRVVFELVDIDAAEDATPTVTSEAEISKLAQTHNRVVEMEKKLATLEQNYFLLDGSFELPDETDNGEVGWWSGEISDSNGAINQVLEFNFTEPQSSIGFTIAFDEKANQYATDFKIEVFDPSDSLVSEDIVVGNTLNRYISEMPVDGYKRVKITFTKTSQPFRRIRVSEVVFGIIQNFDDANTTDLKLLYEISPSMENLPANELTVTIENTDRKYNMINPKGIYKYLQEGQGLNAEIAINGEYVNMGRFYYTNSTAEDSSMTAQIVAHNQFYALDRGLYRKGINNVGTILGIVTDIIEDAGIELNITIPPAIANRVIGRNIPIVSHREALRIVAQASMSSCYIDRNGILTLEELAESTPTDTLDNGNLYTPAKVEVREYINTVETTAYSTHVDTWDGKTEIYQGSVVVNGTKDIWITTNGAQITDVAITNGTLNSAEHYMHASKLNITATGDADIELTGYQIELRETIYRAQNLSGNAEAIKQVENPLIRKENAQVFADWCLSVAQKRLTYKLQERGNPAREIADTVKIYDAYNENRNAIITKQEYQFDGTLKANSEAWGGE